MKLGSIRLLRGAALLLLLGATSLFAAEEAPKNAQDEYEKSIEAIVRQKHFFKAGRFELGGTGGVMPYDSLINHYMLGGRLTWHFADHYGWEMVDVQLGIAQVTNFTTGLVQDKGISNLQTVKLKNMVGTNFLLSPVYGKIRFFGRQVLYFDIYVAAGGGLANTDVLLFSSPGIGQAGVESVVKSGWDPMFNFGFGIKVFLNDAMGLSIDMRDYVVASQVYGKTSLKSNFSVMAGLSFFLPIF